MSCSSVLCRSVWRLIGAVSTKHFVAEQWVDGSQEGWPRGLTHDGLLQFVNVTVRDAYLAHQSNLQFIHFSQSFVNYVLVSDIPAR